MKRSETFGAFAKAFAAFQAEVTNPKMTASNPHLKSKYAPLAEVLNTVRPMLAKHGLSLHQDLSSDADKVTVITTLYHESGEFLESSPFSVSILKGGKMAEAQVMGSAASYAKRYQLQAVVGVAADEDDDGESQAPHNNNNYQAPPVSKPQHEIYTKPQLAAKYQLGTGSRDGFDEYYQSKIDEGWNHGDINKALDKALAKKNQAPVTA
jgi:hypothetical protein